MTMTRISLVPDFLNAESRRVGRYTMVIAASGMLGYDTYRELQKAYKRVLKEEAGKMHRLLIDLRAVQRFDSTGITTLVEIQRDAELRALQLEIVDKSDRPAYIATGLNVRFRFLSPKTLEAMER